MEKEYQKIGNVFKFDEKFRTVVGLNETFEAIKHALAYFKDNYAIDKHESDICNYSYTSKGE